MSSIGHTLLSGDFPQWSGKTWQSHVNAILTIHHHLNGCTYHSVADKVDGDGGLEGFSSDGHAYQCYCDEASVDTADRATKQKRKVTADLKKLETYKDFWEEMLQGVRLVSWTLVVPYNEDKDVLKHTRRKATETRKKNLSFIDVSFHGAVCTDLTGFPLAYQRFLECGIAKIHIPPGEVMPEQIEKLSATRPDFVRNIDTKVAKLLPNNSELNVLQFRKDLLNRYLRGSNILKRLEQNAPALYERIVTVVHEKSLSISLESKFDSTIAGVRLKDTRVDLESSVRSIAGILTDATVTALSWSTVTELLGECFLDFPDSFHV
jgi:hypothetical protein